MKFPAAASAQPSSSSCIGRLHTAAKGTGLPSGQCGEGRQLHSEDPRECTALPSDDLCEASQLPSEHCIEGTGLPSEHLFEGSQLPFVHWLLSLHMDKVQQGQLLQAWLSAGEGPLLSSWQTFLGQCDDAQVSVTGLLSVRAVSSRSLNNLLIRVLQQAAELIPTCPRQHLGPDPLRILWSPPLTPRPLLGQLACEHTPYACSQASDACTMNS